MDFADFQICDRDLSGAQLESYMASKAIAVDTETMGLLPQRDRLCLVQICDPSDRVTVIRIAPGQTAAENLKKLMETATIDKVFHFARFDIATLRYHLQINVSPIFCTKIASKLARTYTNKHGLKDVVQELENIELDKTAQCSDWGNPASLTEKQLRYAANDVRYLLKVREKLMAMLQRENRWELAQQCFASLPAIVSLDLLQFKDIFEH